MNFEELFRDFWWLIFPVFGMAMAFTGMFQSDRRANDVLNLIRSYTDQGKEPPPELVKLAAQSLEPSEEGGRSRRGPDPWSFIVFTALAAAAGTGYYYVRGEDFAFAFLIATVFFAIMGAGALAILLLNRGK